VDRGRKPVYPASLQPSLVMCWSLLRGSAGKLLAAATGYIVPMLRAQRVLNITDAEAELLVRMSAATIDRRLAHVSFGLGATQQEAVERRMALEEAAGIDKRLAHLSAILGLRLDPADRDKALTNAQIRALRPSPGAPQAVRALELASQGRTPHEILGHGILDQNPGLVGTAEQAADMLQD
jgi:hypothetical protein